MAAKFLTDKKGKKTDAVIPFAEYTRMLQRLEELQDIKAYTKAKKVKGKSLPFSEFIRKNKL
jgi:hypothetical protein